MSCKGCNNRHTHCHSECEEYLQQVEQRKEIYRQRAAATEIVAAIEAGVRRRMERRSRFPGF